MVTSPQFESETTITKETTVPSSDFSVLNSQVTNMIDTKNQEKSIGMGAIPKTCKGVNAKNVNWSQVDSIFPYPSYESPETKVTESKIPISIPVGVSSFTQDGVLQSSIYGPMPTGSIMSTGTFPQTLSGSLPLVTSGLVLPPTTPPFSSDSKILSQVAGGIQPLATQGSVAPPTTVSISHGGLVPSTEHAFDLHQPSFQTHTQGIPYLQSPQDSQQLASPVTHQLPFLPQTVQNSPLVQEAHGIPPYMHISPHQALLLQQILQPPQYQALQATYHHLQQQL